MRGTTRNLSAVVCAWLMGWGAQAATSQQTAPVSWPAIAVWGVSGHALGTIRLAQPTVNGVVRYSLIGSFVPADGKLLPELAATLWPGAVPKCLHFNWIQVVIDPGNPPPPVDAAGRMLGTPYLDPPAGGYRGDRKPADSLPWYLDETPFVAGKSANINIHNPNVTLANGLRWFAQPYSATLPDAMHYDTVLVLVNDCAAQYEPLGGFHWTASFPVQGSPFFTITPFGPQEWFAHGSLIAEFAKSSRIKQKARLWTIRPPAKP